MKINTGAGEITYQTDGTFMPEYLMELLKEAIEKHGIQELVEILKMADEGR